MSRTKSLYLGSFDELANAASNGAVPQRRDPRAGIAAGLLTQFPAGQYSLRWYRSALFVFYGDDAGREPFATLAGGRVDYAPLAYSRLTLAQQRALARAAARLWEASRGLPVALPPPFRRATAAELSRNRARSTEREEAA